MNDKKLKTFEIIMKSIYYYFFNNIKNTIITIINLKKILNKI